MKIIHHTAPSNRDDWHPLWIRCHHSWVNNHSGFEFRLWKDEDLDTFVNEKFPQYSKVYNNLPAHILKIDFARYCFLYEQGGIYADMDMYCYKPFYDELEADFTIIQSEFGEDEREIVQNSLMYCSPKNPLMKSLIEMAYERLQNIDRNFLNGKSRNSRDTLYTTGPVLLSEFCIENGDKDISMFEAENYNNLFGSYSDSYYTKHLNTINWGKDVKEKNGSHYHIVNGHQIINGKPFPNKELNDLLSRIFVYKCVKVEEFDFHEDYAKGISYKGAIPPESKYEVKRRFEYVLKHFGIELHTT